MISNVLHFYLTNKTKILITFLQVYLQNISQKTQQADNVGFDDYGDISISSGVQSVTPRGHRTASPAISVLAPSSSKFLKKKAVAKEDGEDDNDDEAKSHKEKGFLITGKKKVKGEKLRK